MILFLRLFRIVVCGMFDVATVDVASAYLLGTPRVLQTNKSKISRRRDNKTAEDVSPGWVRRLGRTSSPTLQRYLSTAREVQQLRSKNAACRMKSDHESVLRGLIMLRPRATKT